MANIDFSAWDASKAWAAGAKSSDPAAFYNAVCAGKKAGDPNTQEAHALPYRYSPSSPPNAAGVKNALARLNQTQGLTNKDAAEAKLNGLMKTIQAAEKNRAAPEMDTRIYRSLHAQDLPGGMARRKNFPSELRGNFIKTGGRTVYHVTGYATVYNRGYEMWDKAGRYTEIMGSRALDISLSQQPDVAFLTNHGGVTMARSRMRSGKNPTLALRSDSTGLNIEAWLNAERQDVKDLAHAIDDEDIDEMSFAFRIEDFEWDEDYTELSLTRVDINRGDVSAVNFGANPFTNIESRSADLLSDLDIVPDVVARAAMVQLQARFESLTPVPTDDDDGEYADFDPEVLRQEREAAAQEAALERKRVKDEARREARRELGLDDEERPELPHNMTVAEAHKRLKGSTTEYQRRFDNL